MYMCLKLRNVVGPYFLNSFAVLHYISLAYRSFKAAVSVASIKIIFAGIDTTVFFLCAEMLNFLKYSQLCLANFTTIFKELEVSVPTTCTFLVPKHSKTAEGLIWFRSCEDNFTINFKQFFASCSTTHSSLFHHHACIMLC